MTILEELPKQKMNRVFKVQCPKCTEIYILNKRQLRGFAAGVCNSCDPYHYKGPNKNLISRFNGMKQRCYDSKCDEYRYYGGIGVTICDEWLKNRNTFIDWSLKNGYAANKQIDKDIKSRELGVVPAIYSPTTCLWVDAKTNSGNTRRLIASNTSGYRGVSYSKDIRKYTATYTEDNQMSIIGDYLTAIEAAVAYDDVALKTSYERTVNDIPDTTRTIVRNITLRRKGLKKDIQEIRKVLDATNKEALKIKAKLESAEQDLQKLKEEKLSSDSILEYLSTID